LRSESRNQPVYRAPKVKNSIIGATPRPARQRQLLSSAAGENAIHQPGLIVLLTATRVSALAFRHFTHSRLCVYNYLPVTRTLIRSMYIYDASSLLVCIRSLHHGMLLAVEKCLLWRFVILNRKQGTLVAVARHNRNINNNCFTLHLI
jgi:hypothetical protein